MEIGLKIFGQMLSVNTDDRQLSSYLSNLKKIHVFEVRILEPELLPYDVPTLVHRRGERARLKYDPESRTVELIANWEQISASGTLENILGQLAGLACFDVGLVPVHGGAISISGEMYLLVGGSGAGKSSLCLAMMAMYGARWEANDYFCLGRAADQRVYVRQVDDYFDFRVSILDELKDNLPSEILSIARNKHKPDSWAKSPAISLNTLRNPPDPGSLVPIKGIIFPAITASSQATVAPFPKKAAAASLIREIVWPIRGVGSFVLGNDGTVLAASPSIHPTAGWQPVCDLVTDLISDSKAWAATGSVRSLPEAMYSTVITE